MTESSVPAPPLDPADVDGVIQAVRFELFRENIYGALDILEAAQVKRPHSRYVEQSARIRSWLGHLESREAYVAAQEQQYRGLRWKMGLKLLEKQLRMLSGKKTRKMIERRGRDPEFQELDRRHLALELLELRIAAAPLDHLAGLLAGEHAQLLLQELETHLPAQAPVLLLLRGHVGLAALQVAEPGADARGLLDVAGMRALGLGGLQDVERAVDVLAEELEAHGLDHAVHVGGIEGRGGHRRLGHERIIPRRIVSPRRGRLCPALAETEDLGEARVRAQAPQRSQAWASS